MRSVEPGEAWRWCYVDDQLGWRLDALAAQPDARDVGRRGQREDPGQRVGRVGRWLRLTARSGSPGRAPQHGVEVLADAEIADPVGKSERQRAGSGGEVEQVDGRQRPARPGRAAAA